MELDDWVWRANPHVATHQQAIRLRINAGSNKTAEKETAIGAHLQTIRNGSVLKKKLPRVADHPGPGAIGFVRSAGSLNGQPGKPVADNRVPNLGLREAFYVKFEGGMLVPIPTSPISTMLELPKSSGLGPVNLAIRFGVPLMTKLRSGADFAVSWEAAASDFSDVFCEPAASASTNAEAGLPPSVSASATLSAYGTLTSSTRGCSSSPGSCSCTPSQRASPELNSSSGRPSLFVPPNRTVYRPYSSSCTFCSSSHSGLPPC